MEWLNARPLDQAARDNLLSGLQVGVVPQILLLKVNRYLAFSNRFHWWKSRLRRHVKILPIIVKVNFKIAMQGEV